MTLKCTNLKRSIDLQGVSGDRQAWVCLEGEWGESRAYADCSKAHVVLCQQ